MPPGSPVAGFVLVGGQSRRMGRAKALLELQGTPMLLRAAQLLRPHVDSVSLLGSPRRYARFGLPVLEDEYGSAGPLGALATGLKHSSGWGVFLACDLPFVQECLVEQLVRRIPLTGAEALVPKTGAGWQPLCAAYHASCLPVMEGVLARGDWSILGLLPSLRVEEIAPQPSEDICAWEQMFWNVNTPVEWKHARRSIEKR